MEGKCALLLHLNSLAALYRNRRPKMGKDVINGGKPFVKWVGGKSQLLSQYDKLLPRDLSRCKNLTYVEPFVGGGAMLFHMLQRFPNIRRVVINDINKDLITTYRAIKEKPRELINLLSKLQKLFRSCKGEDERRCLFLKIRSKYNSRRCNPLETASLFIFLNRTGFNGLYRVNSEGRYNVSFGKCTNPLICDVGTICADSELLQKVSIRAGDFAEVFDDLKGEIFAYLDPPYRPLTKTANFTGYSKEGFGDDEQRRLASLCREMDKSGFRWLASNSDPRNVNVDDNFFDELYSGFEIHRVMAKRIVNSDAGGRGKITELVIRNYAN